MQSDDVDPADVRPIGPALLKHRRQVIDGQMLFGSPAAVVNDADLGLGLGVLEGFGDLFRRQARHSADRHFAAGHEQGHRDQDRARRGLGGSLGRGLDDRFYRVGMLGHDTMIIELTAIAKIGWL